MKQKTPEVLYTEPQISCANNLDWFVWFRYYHADKWHKRQYREGINRIPIKKRKIEAEELLKARHDWLKMGWNPIIDPEFKLRKVKKNAARQDLLFNDALDYALSKKDLADKSKQDYRNMLNYIKDTAITTGHSLLDVIHMDRGTCLDLMDECSRIRNFSNHAYNKYISCLRAMFTVLLDRRIISQHPLTDLIAKDVPESNKYAAYTPQEKKRIAEHLGKVHPRFFVVMSVVYHTGIRPKEALALLISDIDMAKGVITIAPDAERENSKGSNVRSVPINNELKKLFKQMNFQNYARNYFVFGSPSQPGKGNTGTGSTKTPDGTRVSGAMRQDYFIPHPVQVDRDTVTKLWKKLVIDGLGINKHLYAAKHTGTDDKIEAGIELKDIQYLYGHESEAMTKRYAKKKREFEAKKEILAKSPAFSTNKLRKVI